MTIALDANVAAVWRERRRHDGGLWLLRSGIGEFGRVDERVGRFMPIAFVPGFAHGVSFVGGSTALANEAAESDVPAADAGRGVAAQPGRHAGAAPRPGAPPIGMAAAPSRPVESNALPRLADLALLATLNVEGGRRSGGWPRCLPRRLSIGPAPAKIGA